MVLYEGTQVRFKFVKLRHVYILKFLKKFYLAISPFHTYWVSAESGLAYAENKRNWA